MEAALTAFYYQFHHHQHYFLCHDILEDAWKENETFSKTDDVVSLILLATGCYHYRRGNLAGAARSFKKAYAVVAPSEDLSALGVETHTYTRLLQRLAHDATQGEPFRPVEIPMTAAMTARVREVYPDYVMQTEVVEDTYIRHHHKVRNRDEVIAARAEALAARAKTNTDQTEK